MSLDASTLLIIPLLAVLAPLLSRGIARWLPVPIVVFELLLGIVAGPSVLGWAHPGAFIDELAEFGLATLFFVAGTEIQFQALQGRSGKRSALGWLVSIAAGVGLGWVIAPGEPGIIIGIALASTALGTLLPILRDAGEMRTPFGLSVSALGTVGEFGPLLAISIFLGGREPGRATIVLAIFAAVAAISVWYALRVPQGKLHSAVSASLHTSAQFAVRVMLLILAALVTLSIVLDIDMLLGAFVAGVVWRIMMRDADPVDRDAVESKIEGIAFGFLVPIFFIYTGVTFNLDVLTADPRLLLLVLVALVALVVVRGLPSVLAAPAGSTGRDKVAIMLMGATGLPIIVAVTAIGVDEKIIDASVASVLVGAGMLSVLLFPLIAMSLRGARSSVTTAVLKDQV